MYSSLTSSSPLLLRLGSRTKKGPTTPRVVRPHCLRARRLRRRTWPERSGPVRRPSPQGLIREQAVGGVLDLERRVVDPEALVQQRLELAPDPVAVLAARRRARGPRGRGSPELISQTCRSWTSVTPGVAAHRRRRSRPARAPPGAASSRTLPEARRSGQAVEEHRAGDERARRSGRRGRSPSPRRRAPATAVAGERVEVGEEVPEAALDVQVLAVRPRDLPEGEDVDGGARERGRRARAAPSTSGGESSRRSASTTIAKPSTSRVIAVRLRGEDLGAAEAERHAALRRAAARAAPPRRSSRAPPRRPACAPRPRAARASGRRRRATTSTAMKATISASAIASGRTAVSAPHAVVVVIGRGRGHGRSLTRRMNDGVVFVEIPAGSRNKYEWDDELGGHRRSTGGSSPR